MRVDRADHAAGRMLHGLAVARNGDAALRVAPLRLGLDLYANIRPSRSREGSGSVRSFANVCRIWSRT